MYGFCALLGTCLYNLDYTSVDYFGIIGNCQTTFILLTGACLDFA